MMNIQIGTSYASMHMMRPGRVFLVDASCFLNVNLYSTINISFLFLADDCN
jgi:hypothetical protein